MKRFLIPALLAVLFLCVIAAVLYRLFSRFVEGEGAGIGAIGGAVSELIVLALLFILGFIATFLFIRKRLQGRLK